MEKKNVEKLKEKYEKEIEKEKEKTEILIKIFESFKKYNKKYKRLGNVVKAVTKETGIKIRKIKDNITDDNKLYIPKLDKTIIGYMDKKKNNLEKGILREIGQDRLEKLKKEYKQLDKIVKKYNKAVELLNEIKENSPKIEKVEYTLREPETHFKEPTYFLKGELDLLGN